jgi:hypothetical protein
MLPGLSGGIQLAIGLGPPPAVDKALHTLPPPWLGPPRPLFLEQKHWAGRVGCAPCVLWSQVQPAALWRILKDTSLRPG